MVDTIIRQCFQTFCKDWMSECHWYCDAAKDQRCKDCLSWRGQQCIDCFDI
uniref:Zn_Tnp_IS91 domain-containing protein n=1 Tax=Angiostrongylus cantonensis TaxID=6313 RepID=A0A0K0CSW2_ANGCA